MRIKLSLAALLSMCLLGHAMGADNKFKPAKYSKVCMGGEGITVTILPLLSPENHALVQIKGIEGDMDKKVIMHRIARSGDLVQTYKGKDWVTVTAKTYEGGQTEYHVYPPGMNGNGVEIGCQQVESKEGADEGTENPLALLKDYRLEQQGNSKEK